jgi:hypothetical protein
LLSLVRFIGAPALIIADVLPDTPYT